LQLAALELLAYRQLDLPLSGHAQLSEELAHRHVEDLFVHRLSSSCTPLGKQILNVWRLRRSVDR